jgi:drug/metabolite transporter (DMT)-like permease
VFFLGHQLPGHSHWPRIGVARHADVRSLYGIITIGIGTGAVAYSELWIPSGLTALFVTTQPFWMVAIDAMTPGGERLHLPGIGGMLVGLAGVGFLISPSVKGSLSADAATHAASHAGLFTGFLAGFLVLQLGQACWSGGSIAQRRLGSRAHPIVNGAIHQLATGLAFGIVAAFDGQPATWNFRGIAALAYLTVFGSALGYSAYSLAIDRLPVALVSLYTYINPIVAVALGWLFYREPFGWRETIAMAIIFAGVAIVKQTSRMGRKPALRESVPVE